MMGGFIRRSPMTRSGKDLGCSLDMPSATIVILKISVGSPENPLIRAIYVLGTTNHTSRTHFSKYDM
jgi:hypothetical protein